ncbi:MAG: phosphatase PAP2 family protein [Acidobacteria bacterium]|nr:phosphatase PAP2 family protein [Acidobacteriota bacterium]
MSSRWRIVMAFAFWFGLVYMASDTFADGRAEVVPHFNWELGIPFFPQAAWIYLSILPVFAWIAWRMPHRYLRALALTLALQVLIAGCCFLAWPYHVAYSSPVTHDALFRIADLLNLTYNLIPSLHVSFAMGIAFALVQAYRRWRWFVLIWAVGVSLAALFTHQHHLFDIAAGALLAVVTHFAVFRPAMQDLFWHHLRAEMVCHRAQARFARRHRRYAFIWLVLTLQSLISWKGSRLARYGYCCIQWVDDLVDGDWPAVNPLDVVMSLEKQWGSGTFENDNLSFLASMVYQACEMLDRPDEARASFGSLIYTMSRDYHRRVNRQTWDLEDLASHVTTTFSLSLELLLIFSGCQSRSADWSDLVTALGWCSVARDLEDDLHQGLINIPRSVWVSFSEPPNTWQQCLDNPHFVAWYFPFQHNALEALARAQAQALSFPDKKTVRTLKPFLNSIAKYQRPQPIEIEKEVFHEDCTDLT